MIDIGNTANVFSFCFQACDSLVGLFLFYLLFERGARKLLQIQQEKYSLPL